MKAPTLVIALSLCACMQLSAMNMAAFAADNSATDPTADKPAADAASMNEVPADNNETKANVPNLLEELGPALAKKLQDLEAHFFGHLYVTEQVERRIVRLERFIFGTESGGPFPTRIDHIAGSLNVSDPDGSKREVKLKPKEETPAKQEAPVVESPAPQLNDLAKEAAEAPSAIPKLVDSPDEHLSTPQMEVTPVLGATPRKIAEISTAVMPDRQHGPTLQITKDFFATVGKPSEIIKELDQAIRIHPSDPELMFERGKAYIQLDKFNMALNDLSDAIMNQPNKSAYYLARAWCYRKLGNSYLAADDVKQAHFVDPGLPPQVDFVLNGKAAGAAAPASAAAGTAE
jgi:hypothetical protein